MNVVNGSNTLVATGLNYPKDLRGVPPIPLYSVSGRVNDAEGTPMSNVVVSDGIGHTTVTETARTPSPASPAGAYTIRASKPVTPSRPPQDW